MKRLTIFYVLFVVATVAIYLGLVQLFEQRTIIYHETIFNEQQAAQAALIAQGLTDHFERTLSRARVMATHIMSGFSEGLFSPANVQVHMLQHLVVDPTFLTWGFFPDANAPQLIFSAPGLQADEPELQLRVWVTEFWEVARSAETYYVVPVEAAPDHQWYGLLYPIFVGGRFAGIEAQVIDFGAILGRYVVLTDPGQDDTVLVLDADGLVLYSSDPDNIGWNIADLYGAGSATQSTISRILTEDSGQGGFEIGHASDEEPVRDLLAWCVAPLGDRRLTILLSAPGSRISAAINLYRQYAWLLGILLAFALGVAGALFFLGRQRGLQHVVEERTRDLQRKEQSLRQYNQAMLVLSNTAIAITSALDVDEILQRLVKAAEQVFPESVAVTIQLLDQSREMMETFFASASASETPEKVAFRPGVGIAGHAIAERRLINVPDIHADPRFVPGVKPPPFRSLLVAPLITGSSVWGTLSVEGKQIGAFNEQDEVLVNLLARQAGVALENARLYQSEQRQREIAETLRDIGIALTGATRQEELLRRILEQVGRVLPYDAAGIWLPDEDGVYRLWMGFGYEELGVASQIEQLAWTPAELSVLMEINRTGRTLIVPDVQSYDGWFPIQGFSWLRSWAGAPILLRGELAGILCLDHTEPDFYGPHHEPILEALAAQVSIAVENARLFEQVQDHAQYLQEEVRARTAEVQIEQERTETILRSIDDGVLMADLDGYVTYANRAFISLLGWPEHKVLGRPLADFLHATAPPEDLKGLLAAVCDGHSWRGDLVMRHRDGYAVEVEISAAPYRESNGGVKGFIASLRDIGADRALERMKGQFMTLVSHELRTPLTTLQLHLHLLRRVTDLSDAGQRSMEALEQQTARLAQLMEKILSATRLTDHGAVDTSGRVTFESLLENVRVRFSGAAEKSHITLSILPPPTALPPVYGDESWLSLACYELVDNALTYTQAGGQVTVRLEYEKGQPESYVLFQVIDSGPGIDPDDLAELNRSFVRVGAQRSGTTAGMGLGLFIARSVAEHHGGALVVESEPGVGSTFSLRLPVRVV